MPIRTVPFDQITAATCLDLIARGIREDRTLDFKRELSVASDRGKNDLLQDVVAMANASGGTILYGAVEGKDEKSGQIVGLNPMQFAPDDVQSAIENIIRDGIDERLTVNHRAIPHDGGFLYVIRIPASPLAPHMVKAKSRFYLRGATSNDPMMARQIKELALRSETAVDRAVAVIAERTQAAKAAAERFRLASEKGGHYRPASPGVALLHAIPLFPPIEPVNLAQVGLPERFKNDVLPFGTPFNGNTRWGLEGLYSADETNAGYERWALLLRTGGLEWGSFNFTTQGAQQGYRYVDLSHLDNAMMDAARRLQAFAETGWVGLPIVLSLRLLSVEGAYLGSHAFPHFASDTKRVLSEDVVIPPVVVSTWGPELDAAVRTVLNTTAQAWGSRRWPYYDEDGNRKP